jgi:hypothetical protein
VTPDIGASVGKPWILSGFRDPDAARLLTAVKRRSKALLRRHARVPVQEQPLRSGDESPESLFPVNALIHLWDKWPAASGSCPSCGEVALAIGYGGLLSDAYVHGVCLCCARLVHRFFHGIGELRRDMRSCMFDSPSVELGSWALNSSNGLPHTSLVTALRSLGECDLPHAHRYGFVGGHPKVRNATAADDALVENLLDRADTWSFRFAPFHSATDARLDSSDRVRDLVRFFVVQFLHANDRLPEGPLAGPHELRLEFPFVRDASDQSTTASSVVDAQALDRYLVIQVARDAVFEEIVWSQDCWCAENAHAALEQRAADARQTNSGTGDIYIFDRLERRLVRSLHPVADAQAVVAEWLLGEVETEDTEDEPTPTFEVEESDEAEDESGDDGDEVETNSFEFIQPTADIVIHAMREGRCDEDALERLVEWFDEYRGNGSCELDMEDAVIAIEIDRVAERLHGSDADEIASCFGIEDEDLVSVDDRVRYAEEHLLPRLLDDADIASCFVPVAIEASDGTCAVMVANIQGYSFTCVTTEWLGPFPSWPDYVASLKREGWVTCVEEFADLPIAEKLQRLEAWR